MPYHYSLHIKLERPRTDLSLLRLVVYSSLWSKRGELPRSSGLNFADAPTELAPHCFRISPLHNNDMPMISKDYRRMTIRLLFGEGCNEEA